MEAMPVKLIACKAGCLFDEVKRMSPELSIGYASSKGYRADSNKSQRIECESRHSQIHAVLLLLMCFNGIE